jgi:phosphate-selective porin OprO/OprP
MTFSQEQRRLAGLLGQGFVCFLAFWLNLFNVVQAQRAEHSDLTALVSADSSASFSSIVRQDDEVGSPSLEDFEKRLKALEKAQEKAESKTAEKPKAAGEGGNESDNKWTVKLGGHIQADYTMWTDTDPSISGAHNYFSFRRLRLVADGTGYKQFDFRLQMTLEPGQGSHENQFASPDVKDAYVSMNDIPGIGRFRIGNFFVPFSLEQVTNDTNNIFHERSIPTQGIFAVDREIGMAVYNCTPSKSLSWATGIFFDDLNDTIKTRFDANQGYRVSGRLVWVPYYDEAEAGRHVVHAGLGILHTDAHNDTVRFRARPQVQRGPVLIDSGNLGADSYTTGGAELAVVWGPVTIQNEAFLSQVNLLSGQSAQVGGAYSHLSYFLTGENRMYERFGQHGAQFARNKPAVNFYATKDGNGWGAWEAKVRWSYLDLSNVSAGQYNDLSAGLNWYWSDRTRIMFDWIHPLTTANTVFGSTESDLLAVRFDVNW